MTFAAKTKVSEQKSKLEIEALLTKYGASRFASMTDYDTRIATIGFTYKFIHIKMEIPLPDPKDKKFTLQSNGWSSRTDSAADELFRQEVRRRWRCLALSLKAKLVSVTDGITTFEREFMPYMIQADGSTLGDAMLPLIRHAMLGKGPLMLEHKPQASE